MNPLALERSLEHSSCRFCTVRSSVTDTGSDTEVSENTVSLFEDLRILELRLETGGE